MNWNWGKQPPGSGNGNIFINSTNQTGGITAHTVNFGPVPRQLNDNAAAIMHAGISKAARINVTAVMGDGEALNFATQIYEWLRANGYQHVTGVDQAVYTQPVFGQRLETNPDGSYEIIIGNHRA